jgi:hypothetical protein
MLILVVEYVSITQNNQNVNKTPETPTPPNLMLLCRLERTWQMWVSERFPSHLQGKYRLTFVQRYLVVNNVAIAQSKNQQKSQKNHLPQRIVSDVIFVTSNVLFLKF